MSWRKKPSDRDKEVTSTGEKCFRKKRERIIRKKISSLSLLCGSLKPPNPKKQIPDEKRKPQKRIGPKESKLPREEMCCGRTEHPWRMCAKCEIVSCRKCDTLHAHTLFVAHSLLDHYDV